VNKRLTLERLCIALVAFLNLQCALAFLISPAAYVHGFELEGVAGEAAVRGMGILFAMWNVPYVVALWHPVRHRTSLIEAVIMQAVGLVGESAMLLVLEAGHAALRATAMRFIVFDGLGLILLLIALLLGRSQRRV